MEIGKTYQPKEAEKKWYKYWMDNGLFSSKPSTSKKPYTIVIPPPNVTGVLHMGHMLNNTIQDVLIRRARMVGYNACWVPGTDHASIATEAKVVSMLKEKGISKSELSREEFLKHAWEWKEKYGGIILEQLKKLGASCDWNRTRFTMEPSLSDAVLDVFIDLYNKGHIYRGVRMINWDPQGLTAVSDEEVIYKEKDSLLVYISYPIKDSSNSITIATTRPETIMADTAVCVHPEDERYKHLKGKFAVIPLINREVPIIFDEYIDREFGTGALKVTPAHDINDYNLGLKHKLPVINGLTEDGKISKEAGLYIGMDRFACRKQIIKDLQEKGFVTKTETIKNKVGHSERTDAVIEPRLSLQWFLKMEKLAKPALDSVLTEEVTLIPEKYINTYRHWMENVHDWCISRQLWWGQQIPAWYDNDGNTVVCKTKEEALNKFKEINPNVQKEQIKQDEDVLDTWFSSWLWPLTVFDPDIIKNGWNKANEDLRYFYPTADLVTAPEILFFWVARMIMAGKEYTGKAPFKNVYLTGIVRDKLGRKMSKSLGNSPDPLDLIEKYGADGVRVGMLLSSPAGNDLLFDESYCEQGRNFANKIWNAYRLIQGFNVNDELPQNTANKVAVNWFNSRFNEQLEILNDLYSKYRISDALMTTYKLVWDDFCAWYLEMIKPEFINGQATSIDKDTFMATIDFLEKLLKLLHPFMPFISEEIWQQLKTRTISESLIVSEWPKLNPFDSKLIERVETLKELVSQIRALRQQKNISPKEKIKLIQIEEHVQNKFCELDPIVIKLANLSDFTYSPSSPEGSHQILINGLEFFVPLEITNPQQEKERLLKELDYSKGFLASVQKKLANEKFVQNAKPELVELERKKEKDALQKIQALEEQLNLIR